MHGGVSEALVLITTGKLLYPAEGRTCNGERRTRRLILEGKNTRTAVIHFLKVNQFTFNSLPYASPFSPFVTIAEATFVSY
jgi:hypothetical protein